MNHWVPSYLETTTKKTGIIVDGNGNRLNSDNENNHNNDIFKNNGDNIIFNVGKNNKEPKNYKKNATNYKDINSYKPEGKLIYNDDLLKKLNIND